MKIKPNINLTKEQLLEDKSFSSPLFGQIQQVKQEVINLYSRRTRNKRKIKIKVI